MDAVTVAVALIMRINVLLGPIGAIAGALRASGNLSTQIAVLIASIGFAIAAYFAAIVLAVEFIPDFDERYRP